METYMSENQYKEDARKALTYWRTPLGFKEWSVSLRFVKMKNEDGKNYWSAKRKEMKIICDPTSKHEPEFMILHELLHPFLDSNNSTTDMLDFLIEGFIDDMAKMLITIRKNQGHKL